MKVKATLSHLISDFAGMSKTPDFKPKHDGHHSPSSQPSSPKAHTAARRHSLNITVGATEISRSQRRNSISVTSPTQDNDEMKPKFDAHKRRQSAPSVMATADQTAALKKKLEQLKIKKTHSDEDIQEEEEE